MSDDSTDAYDQDAEPTMTAPPEGRPDGTQGQAEQADGEGVHPQDGPDQTGAEADPAP